MDYMQGDDMANASTATFKVSVLRCRKTGRVLFLEAGKDFVDTLFSFLLLPVGTILHMALSNSGTFDATTVMSQIGQLCHKPQFWYVVGNNCRPGGPCTLSLV